MTEALTPLSVDALVQLRALLDHARSVSRSGSRPTRLVAVVLLDGVNERAIHLAATTLSVEVTARATFEDLHSQVKQRLDTRWRGEGWSDVRKLHRVRNLAQHEGTGGDREEIAAWRTATEKYVRSLITAVFDVDLDQVRLADCIVDDQIREFFVKAEDALGARNALEALGCIYNAFDDAKSKWRRSSRAPNRLERRWRRDDPFRDVIESVNQVNDANLDQVFAFDSSEYVWFSHLRREEREYISLDEAERALTFAFWWITAWEAASEWFVHDRRRRWAAERRKEREGTGDPNITDVTIKGRREITNGQEGRYWEISLTLANLPGDPDYNDWHAGVSMALFQQRIQPYGPSMRLDPVGIVICRVPDDAEWNPEHLIEHVEGVLVDEKRAMEAAKERAHAADVERQRVIAEFDAEVEANKAEMPAWVDSIRKRQRGTEWSIQIEPLEGFYRHVAEELKAAGVSLQPPGAGLVIVGDVSFRGVLDYIKSIDETVKARAAQESEQAREFRAKAEALEGTVRAELARRGNRSSHQPGHS